ncbi:MAG: sugar ABC transporter permease [bacterium]
MMATDYKVVRIFLRNRSGYGLMSPYFLFFLFFVGYPLLFSLVLVFHRWSIVGPLEWIGLDNFREMLGDGLFWKAMGNTLLFISIHIPLQIATALLLAIVLNQRLLIRGFFRAAFFLPVVVSGVAVTILWKQFYGTDIGLFNQLLGHIGINRIPWITSPQWAMPSIAIMATWKNVGLYIIIFLAGLQGVPRSLYEAAEMDGANTWQKFRYITVPAINPAMVMVVILSTINGFNLFIEPYVMTGGGPMHSTLSGVLYVYKQAFNFFRMGYAATIGFSIAAIIMIVVLIQRKLFEHEVD